ncbi:hypothetical protein JCM16418A_08280 [Paenibacillus pini]|uniref:Uncharacterized protein n=2 Tax=Paenibacillus TaxID=44249 RepID=W7YDS6_9BACL|nr:hypothetical protein JCM16418_587 [Paenibacillus pini JCM 16418]
MSLYRFIGSEQPLPEVGIVKMKVKDIKTLKNVPLGPWDEMDDDVEIWYGEEEEAINITLCASPPDGLEEYINMKFVYWLECRIPKDIQQVYQYIEEQVPDGILIELWSICFGEGVQEITNMLFKKNELTVRDLEFLDYENCCIRIE